MTETYEQKVEKVARAIYKSDGGHPEGWAGLSALSGAKYLAHARAALAALGITDTAPAPAISGGEIELLREFVACFETFKGSLGKSTQGWDYPRLHRVREKAEAALASKGGEND